VSISLTAFQLEFKAISPSVVIDQSFVVGKLLAHEIESLLVTSIAFALSERLHDFA
jgi:hypothetical protein